MKAYGIELLQLRKAAGLVHVDLYQVKALNKKGTGWQFTIRPSILYPEKWRSVNPVTGRRVHAVCWHGHRAFFRKCFEYAPKARFKSTIETWNGSEDFESRHLASGFKNRGSMIAPFYVNQACRCDER